MISFKWTDTGLCLHYQCETDPQALWLLSKFKSGNTVTLRKCFTLSFSDLIEPEFRIEDIPSDTVDFTIGGTPYEDEFVFLIGRVCDEYCQIDPHILGTNNRFFILRGIPIGPESFIAYRNISILRRLDRLMKQDFYIGGSKDNAIPIKAYQELLIHFPTSTELDKYAAARIDACIRDYVDTVGNPIEAYQGHLNRRIKNKPSTLFQRFSESELAKHRAVLDRLNEMLGGKETDYTEGQWQQEILAVIKLLYPKYIRVFDEVRIKDTVNRTHRRLDLMLVDAAGHIDLIEIKKPFDRCILSGSEYRKNYVPTKELSGSIMQLEKYIFYLNKWGGDGERILTERYRDKLPAGLNLKVVNPQGIVIMGRSYAMSQRQQQDFEVIKRKYRSIVDVITYDDLLARVKAVVDSLSDTIQKQVP